MLSWGDIDVCAWGPQQQPQQLMQQHAQQLPPQPGGQAATARAVDYGAGSAEHGGGGGGGDGGGGGGFQISDADFMDAMRDITGATAGLLRRGLNLSTCVRLFIAVLTCAIWQLGCMRRAQLPGIERGPDERGARHHRCSVLGSPDCYVS